MASDFRQQIQRVDAKTRVLGEKYLALKTAYDASRQEITELKAMIVARDSAIRDLNVKLENATVAASLAATADDLDKTKAVLAIILRDIDRCIADLLE